MPTVDEHDTSHTGSVPLIPLSSRRRNYSPLGSDHTADDFGGAGSSSDTAYHGGGGATTPNNYYHHPQKQKTATFDHMASGGGEFATSRNQGSQSAKSKKSAVVIISSYVFDWVIILAILGLAYYLNDREPNRRPFSLVDPNISFPFTEHETVPAWLLVLLNCGVPVLAILLVALVLVPGHTVPRGTPRGLVWRRKLWELHVGWLGLALALAGVWLVTNGMKNWFGKPRPDALARCNPDLANWADHVVGGANVGDAGANYGHRLVAATICRGMAGRDDAQKLLADGFRSYPSGHASSAAAGLIYLSLFIASKFAITFPFLTPGNHSHSPTSYSAFPSRHPKHQQRGTHPHNPDHLLLAAHNASLASARRQAAAPPLYLLAFAMAPFFTAVFIAASRWYDFRHHGFDILFGFLMGTASAFFAFRWYHLPVARGAGWAWAPRCADKAWWAGVGSFSYAMDWEEDVEDVEEGLLGGAPVGGVGRQFSDVSAMEEGGRRDKSASMASSGDAYGHHGSGGVMGLDGDQEARRRVL